MHRFISLLLLLSISQPVTKCLLEEASQSRNRPEKDTSTLSPTGHFMIHYDIEGSAAPNLTDTGICFGYGCEIALKKDRQEGFGA